MVLLELGSKLQSAFRSLNSSSKLDTAMVDKVIKEICTALLESDVNIALVKTLRNNIKEKANLDSLPPAINKLRLIQTIIYDQLVLLVDPKTTPWAPAKKITNIVMMVGLQGCGKTTTCTKLACYYQRKGFKVALVCTDTFRAGAFDQLKQNATRANIPFYGSYSETDPVQLALEGVEKFKGEGFDLIIVDTSGRHKQEVELFNEMQQISSVIQPTNSIFVMDATIGQAADAQSRAFSSAVKIGSIIITKMDGHAKGGGAISAVAATNANIIFIGTGEHIHDFESFNPKGFVSKMLGMGDLSGLMETVKDLKLDQNKGLMENLEKGKFTLRDMREQFNMISGMGPLSKVMQMMPGMPAEMAQMGDKEGANKIKKFQCIIDSMTEQELDCDGKLFTTQTSRIFRVAKGSGGTVREVEELLKQHKMFADMVKSLGGSKGMKNAVNSKGQLNPAAMQKMQSGIQKMIPKEVLDQIGGMSGMQEMMNQMMGGGGPAGMGGMGGMQKMMEQMMGGGGMGSLGAGGPSGSSPKQKPKRK